MAAVDGLTLPKGHVRTASRFLRSIFAGQDHGVVALFDKPSNVSTFVSLEQEDWSNRAAQAAVTAREKQNVYFAIGVQSRQPLKGRGKQEGVVALPGLWADVDVLGPNHVATNLPPTLEDAWTIIRAVEFRPTVVVYSGGGLQPYWLFREPMDISTNQERNTAKKLSRAFQAMLMAIAARSGWAIDNTSDLCRLLRLPGTYNRKQPTPVLIEYEVVDRGPRYNPSDFEELFELEQDPELKAHVRGTAPANPSADFRRVLAQCPWIRHCKDDARTLSEPEWYRMLSIVGRCKDGDQIAHEVSQPYPKYTAAETEKKLGQAIGAAGPATCGFIERELGQASYCRRCSHRGTIKSPIVLGLPRRHTQMSGKESAGASPPSTRVGRLPNIQTTDRQLRDVSRESLVALRAFNDPPSLFVRSGKAMCVIAEEDGRHVMTEVTDRILRNRLTRSADFYEVTSHGIRNCAPPIDMVRDILAMAPIDWAFPALQGIIESPALRDDGSIIMSPGYDAASRLFYAPGPALDLSVVPDRPTADHVEVALDLIQDVIADFPFVDDASRANAIASMLTPVCRPAIKGPTPLALYDATTQGTGKTLLSEVVSLIVSGRESALFSAPRDGEEWRKQLTSVLRDGSSSVTIDNVTHRLDSSELCKAITATVYGDRILGRSETVNLPVRCTWIATGNNIQLGGDMPRRCYWIRMDAQCPRPFERTGFRHKRLKQHALIQRGKLLAALLALARSWFVAGRPEPDVTPVGSFEDWTVIVGGVLQHVGVSGFLANSNQLYEQADVESGQWEGFLRTLNTAFYGEPFTVALIWERMNEKLYSEGKRQLILTTRAEELRAALPGLIAEAIDREGFFKQRLGTAFGARRGRRYANSQIRIEQVGTDTHSGVARWKVLMA